MICAVLRRLTSDHDGKDYLTGTVSVDIARGTPLVLRKSRDPSKPDCYELVELAERRIDTSDPDAVFSFCPDPGLPPPSAKEMRERKRAM